ncbi:hypothetical protein AWF41_10605 [Escherichia coli]|nr:hypothetical protein AWF41_10605 [Escherichia coli]
MSSISLIQPDRDLFSWPQYWAACFGPAHLSTPLYNVGYKPVWRDPDAYPRHYLACRHRHDVNGDRRYSG